MENNPRLGSSLLSQELSSFGAAELILILALHNGTKSRQCHNAASVLLRHPPHVSKMKWKGI